MMRLSRVEAGLTTRPCCGPSAIFAIIARSLCNGTVGTFPASSLGFPRPAMTCRSVSRPAVLPCGSLTPAEQGALECR
jgi:hypothetical protein